MQQAKQNIPVKRLRVVHRTDCRVVQLAEFLCHILRDAIVFYIPLDRTPTFILQPDTGHILIVAALDETILAHTRKPLAEITANVHLVVHLKRTDRPTAAAKMDLVDGDKKHLHFEGNAMEEIELQDDDLEFVKQFDIIYAERWAKVGRYIKEIRQEGQIWVYDFSKRLEQESNDEIIPYLDYAFFSYDRDDEYVRNFMVKTSEKGAKTVVAMLGEYGSLAYENGKFYKLDAEKVEVVNTVGAGDSYIAAFTYGVSLGEDIMQCMRRGRQRATEIIQQFNPYK